MPRMRSQKTKKSAQKRFKITATGKVMHFGAGKRHLLGNKSSKRKRQLGRSVAVSPTHAHHITNVLPFSHRG
ncbi:50S ribosomal protein L35 [bacterium]|nr:50S ribosomal protein L35 [bacterium]